MTCIKNPLLTLLFSLPFFCYGQETLVFAHQKACEASHNVFSTREALYATPYYSKPGSGSTGRTLRIIGVVAAGTGLSAVLLDNFVIKTPGAWLFDVGAVIAVSGGPLFTVGSIVRHFELYGKAGITEIPAYASVKKQVSLGITRGGAVGLFIDL